VTSPRPFVRGEILSVDRVAVTAAEKRALRERTGAAAVEMEAAAVEAKAREWGVAFRCVKVVSDVAVEDMPLDFNLYRDAGGRFSRGRIALAAMARPFSVMPRLLRLDQNCRTAAERLGEFFADCTL
jgi:adenosylhomocysteine nucleosidase